MQMLLQVVETHPHAPPSQAFPQLSLQLLSQEPFGEHASPASPASDSPPEEEPLLLPLLDPDEEPLLDPDDEPLLDPDEEPLLDPDDEPLLDPDDEPLLLPLEDPLLDPDEEPLLDPDDDPDPPSSEPPPPPPPPPHAPRGTVAAPARMIATPMDLKESRLTCRVESRRGRMGLVPSYSVGSKALLAARSFAGARSARRVMLREIKNTEPRASEVRAPPSPSSLPAPDE
jgi:hypothetical protein